MDLKETLKLLAPFGLMAVDHRQATSDRTSLIDKWIYPRGISVSLSKYHNFVAKCIASLSPDDCM
jgi:hypothetical protein